MRTSAPTGLSIRGLTLRRAAWTAAAVLLWASRGRTADGPPEPWLDEPPFEVAPAKLLAAAQAHPVPAAAAAIDLLEDHAYTYDASGRSSSVHRSVYLIVKSEALQKWATVLKVYDPWYESKPEIRARVITPDGAAHLLDPSTLVESPYGATTPQVFSERRVLTGPLPAVVPGSVVELESTREESAPLFESGSVERLPLRRDVPVRRTRIRIDAPASLTVRDAVRGLDGVAATRTRRGDRVHLSLDLGPEDAIVDPPMLAPPDVIVYPQYAWSTGRSWSEVALQYAAIVDRQIGTPDLRSIVAEASAGASGAPAVIAALVARLHREVRYTGVEFRDAGVVPRPPLETLNRKYGDCKDKATLLVAMLRAAGLQAHVALVAAGPDSDPDDRLPGLGPFNHAIVRVDEPPLWIDATDEYARPGVLTPAVEGRLCLVAREQSDGLLRLPRSGSEDNRVEIDREVALAERGPARVVQTMRFWGIPERNQRQRFGSPDAPQARDRFSAASKEVLRATADAAPDVSDVKDFREPFRIRIEFPDAAIGSASESSATLEIPLAEIAGLLQAMLPPKPMLGSLSRRTAEIAIPWAAVTVCRYRIHPAPGFAIGNEPAQIVESIGPGSLHVTAILESDGTVAIEARLDTVRPRWTAAEVEAALGALDKLSRRTPLVLGFDQLGRKALAEGHVREAIKEFRSLIQLHPTEAVHRSELADALLAGGVGDAARGAAREAVALEPSNPEAYRILGVVMLNDLMGRPGGKGCDLKAAEAAFRKAKELEPSDPRARGALAALLEVNEDGISFGPGARTAEALDEYRAIQDELHSSFAADSMLAALFHEAKFDEVKTRAEACDPSIQRNAFWVAAAAATGPSDETFALASRLGEGPDGRRAVLALAALNLMAARRWTEASGVMAEATRGAPEPAGIASMSTILGKVKRVESIVFERPAERTVAQFLAALADDDAAAAVPRLSAAAPRRAFGRARIREAQHALFGFGDDIVLKASLELPRKILPDLIASAGSWKTEGSDAVGYRVRVSVPDLERGSQMSVFTILSGGQPRVLALGTEPDVLGEEALRRVDKGDLDGALQWLGWAAELEPVERDGDALSVPPFLLFFGDHRPTDAERIRYAAAALVAEGPGAAAALPILEAGSARAKEQQEKFRFDRSLQEAYSNLERWDDLAAVIRRVRRAVPGSGKALFIEGDVLMQQGRWDEFDEFMRDESQAHPGAEVVDHLRFLAARRHKQWDAVDEILRGPFKGLTRRGWQQNELAWNQLMQGKVTEDSVALAQRAVQEASPDPGPAALHTLAAIEAEMGRYEDARESLVKYLAGSDREEPGPDEWYVLGRIAEGYGEADAARADYRRVVAGTTGKTWSDTRTLALRRLAGLASAAGAEAPAKPPDPPH